jgi:N-acetylglucosamine-6-sulfatase
MVQNTYVTTALCSQSGASILTGAYSHVYQIVDNVSPEPASNIYFHYISRKQDTKPASSVNGVYYNPSLNINGKHENYDDSTYITDLLTTHAIDWLKNRNKSKPFFLYLSHKAVHSPVTPAKRHAGMYRQVTNAQFAEFINATGYITTAKEHPGGKR